MALYSRPGGLCLVQRTLLAALRHLLTLRGVARARPGGTEAVELLAEAATRGTTTNLWLGDGGREDMVNRIEQLFAEFQAAVLEELALARGERPVITDITSDLRKHETARYADRLTSAITHFAIHHAAVEPKSVDGRRDAELYAEYHVRHHGWPGIGYAFVIGPDGTIWQTNPLDKWTYHVGSANKYTVGICLVGDFTDAVPPEPQLKATARLVAWLRRVLCGATVMGHKEFSGSTTQCPGDTWEEWKERVT